jgi:hypothetical protein
MGLLLLRAAIGFTATVHGVLCFLASSGSFSTRWILGSLLILSGAGLVAGFLTPLAGLLMALCYLGMAFSWLPVPSWGLHDVSLVCLGMTITGIAIAMLGPGAFSFDCRLFGRREIVVPPVSRPPEA